MMTAPIIQKKAKKQAMTAIVNQSSR
jgi:hypothetical protein